MRDNEIDVGMATSRSGELFDCIVFPAGKKYIGKAFGPIKKGTTLSAVYVGNMLAASTEEKDTIEEAAAEIKAIVQKMP